MTFEIRIKITSRMLLRKAPWSRIVFSRCMEKWLENQSGTMWKRLSRCEHVNHNIIDNILSVVDLILAPITTSGKKPKKRTERRTVVETERRKVLDIILPMKEKILDRFNSLLWPKSMLGQPSVFWKTSHLLRASRIWISTPIWSAIGQWTHGGGLQHSWYQKKLYRVSELQPSLYHVNCIPNVFVQRYLMFSCNVEARYSCKWFVSLQ